LLHSRLCRGQRVQQPSSIYSAGNKFVDYKQKPGAPNANGVFSGGPSVCISVLWQLHLGAQRGAFFLSVKGTNATATATPVFPTEWVRHENFPLPTQAPCRGTASLGSNQLSTAVRKDSSTRPSATPSRPCSSRRAAKKRS
jgi:hypothetical protein